MADGDVRPVPDPTALTTDAVDRAVGVAREYTDGKLAVVLQRLEGIDTATKLLNATVTRVPTETQKEVAHLNGLMDEKFTSVQRQFQERDIRQEREARDNKIAVDAAFAAQKEIAAKQDDSNAKAIEKSERSTEKTIDGLSSKIDDLKERLGAVENIKRGSQQAYTGIYAALGAAVAIIGIILFLTRKGA